MFNLGVNEPLTPELLKKMIGYFNLNVKPNIEHYKNYYDGKHAILKKRYNDATKPCNKTVINYCKNITDSYTGYLAAAGCVSYSSEEDIEEIMNVLRYNDFQTEDSMFLKHALIHGVAHELMYIDKDGKTRFKLINPAQSFGIFDDSLTNDLLYFVRYYEANNWDDSNKYYVDVYSSVSRVRYSMTGINGDLSFVEEEPHYFGQCPANVFYMPEEKSIFDCVLTEQDSFNELISANIDDYNSFVDAFLGLEGMDADKEDIVTMKEERVLLLPEGSKAYWITKNANDSQVQNILKTLQESIYRTSQTPDFSSDSFLGGVSSGKAILYRLTGMETRAATIASLMEMALRRRIELICGIASLKLGEEIYRDIKISFKRNITTDYTETIQLVNALKGTVSDATLLSRLDFIDDVNAELERIKKEKAANMALYNFGGNDDEDNEEEGTE